jgi:hypothetical protein
MKQSSTNDDDNDNENGSCKENAENKIGKHSATTNKQV